jgi:LL-diaminopimelate aminotransferase
MRPAQRLRAIPPFIFAELDRTKRELLDLGVDLIDLGVGDPDLPTVDTAVTRMLRETPNPAHHRYPDYNGSTRFRTAVCDYYQARFGVRPDPDRECIGLIGSKEGLAHLVWAFVDPGDYVLIPDPAFPVYLNQTLLAGGNPYPLPLIPGTGFLPDLTAVPEEVARRAKLLFLNYPNNPTGGVATREFYAAAVAFAQRYDLLICQDACYAEMTYDGYVAPSILEIDGAMDCAVEMYSFSKPFNMTGWRIAAMVGASRAVRALGVVKTNTDSGPFTAIQMAAVAALEENPSEFITEMNAIYARRRDLLVNGLEQLGLSPFLPRGSFYVWCPVPAGMTSDDFTDLLLREAHVMVVPGPAYGRHSEGYVRFALTVSEERISEALERIESALALAGRT